MSKAMFDEPGFQSTVFGLPVDLDGDIRAQVQAIFDDVISSRRPLLTTDRNEMEETISRLMQMRKSRQPQEDEKLLARARVLLITMQHNGGVLPADQWEEFREFIAAINKRLGIKP